mmetsp:Transcript_4643/g.18569  ORF Transcript_4643/g.18569 Transcript_4643/m.18569 type:complete len:217 (+) Transcript_4643:1181-1831(+)
MSTRNSAAMPDATGPLLGSSSVIHRRSRRDKNTHCEESNPYPSESRFFSAYMRARIAWFSFSDRTLFSSFAPSALPIDRGSPDGRASRALVDELRINERREPLEFRRVSSPEAFCGANAEALLRALASCLRSKHRLSSATSMRSYISKLTCTVSPSRTSSGLKFSYANRVFGSHRRNVLRASVKHPPAPFARSSSFKPSGSSFCVNSSVNRRVRSA